MGLVSCKSLSNEIVNTQNADNSKFDHIGEQQQPLSYFNVYRGNNHSHTIFTWTHGGHRDKAIRFLHDPTEFHPDWHVPPGVDWKDHTTISLKAEDYSNRQGLPANHFELAKENGYDFYAITDHSQEPTLQPVTVENRAWQAILNSVEEYDDDPGFVGLSGFEYSRNTLSDDGKVNFIGHINAINLSEYVNADQGQRGPVPPWPEADWSIPQFYDWLKSVKPHGDKGYVVVGFNHPDPDQYYDWGYIDDEIVDIISTFELHSRYGEIRWKAYLRALNKGWKVSPIGVHDNHSYENITDSKQPPPTLVLAPELTREAITRAMRQRRTFASWIEGVELRYSVNGFIMGSTLDKPDKFNFNIKVNTRPSHPDERLRRIQILRNHSGGEDEVEVVAEILLDGDKDEITWAPEIEDSRARYFLLRMHHKKDITDEGDFELHGSTLSAPVWTGR